MLKYRRLHEIILIELIIGLLNVLDLIKNVNLSILDLFKINDKNIITLLLITIFFHIIFSNNLKDETTSSLELELILGLGLIGLSIVILSYDLIVLFLAIELYSLSVYLLVFKNNKDVAQLTILYFLLGSISSSLLLLGIGILYYYSGSLNILFILENFEIIKNYHFDNNYFLYLGISLIFFSILFKLGAAPFQYWVIRVYTQMDIKILIYQSVIPKIVYIILLLFFLQYLNSSSHFILFILLISSLLSLFIAPIGATTHTVNKFKTILAYSSILHVGFLLLGLIASSLNHQASINIIEYLVIYAINTIHLFIGFYLIYFNNKGKLELNKSLLSFFFLISLFSFIGLPPFGGFYAKLNILINCFNTNNQIFYLAILFIIISTLISSFLYLNFVNFLYFKDVKLFSSTITITPDVSYTPYLFSLSSLLLSIYPLLIPYLTPFFDLYLPYL